MRLKSIELAGFKSFVDPTRIEFGEGITAIVGPNGCGKSNIVDAIRWVLGEHSARHLRGGVMDDLIFQGSDARPPVAVCDVELCFAVEPGSLPSPWHELDEIRIRRRLTREGGSDAFINGRMVRLKDVVDLFLDTGVSTRAYAIIEQGAIARMVTARPEERRAIFEEAAGVMKYRSRRREAERKMASTRQNLERVVDLLEEVRTQCRSLKQQASRAERFRRMQQEFERLQAARLAFRYRELSDRLAGIDAELTEARRAEAEAGTLLAAAERTLNEARDRWVAHEARAQEVQDRLRRLEGERAELARAFERAQGEVRLLAERKEQLAARIREAEGRMAMLDEEIGRLHRERDAQDERPMIERCRQAEARLREAELRLNEARTARDEVFGRVESLRRERAQAETRRSRAEAGLARLRERRDRLEADLAESERRRAGLDRQVEEASRALETAEREHELAGRRLAEADAELARAREAREAAARALREAESAVRRLSGEIEELRARTETREVSPGLRDLLRARGGVWVDESLDVPEGLEAAVAAALRGRGADARLPANPGPSALADLLPEAAQAPIAIHLGASGARSGSLAEHLGLDADHPLYPLFAPVLLVDDIARATTADAPVVSRDGWRLEPDGWLVPPAGNRTADRLSLMRRLREAVRRHEEAEGERARAEGLLAEADRRLEQTQARWQDAHRARAESEADLRRAQSERERLSALAQSVAERIERLRADQAALAEEEAHWREQLESSSGVDAAVLSEAERMLEEREAEVRTCEERVAEARALLAQAEQALALFRQAAEALARDLERLERERDEAGRRRQMDQKRLEETDAALAEARDDQGLSEHMVEIQQTIEAVHRELSEVRAAGHELQRQVHEAEKAERAARERVGQAQQQRQSIELMRAQEQTRLDDLEAEIRERCQKEPGALLDEVARGGDGEDPETVLARARELEERLARFGPVNLLAIEEYEQASEREAFLAEQAADLEASLATLEETIGRIDRTMRRRFREVFEQTNAIFQRTFPRLFGGGRAELRLDSDDILTAGVEVIAQPPGKRLQDVGLLSGGEKALTAVGLVFSIFQIKPAPFCVLDEVDAPLDDANVGRFNEMIRELADRVQFLTITHNKITMQAADRLVGVSMPEPGVSRIVAVDLEALPG